MDLVLQIAEVLNDNLLEWIFIVAWCIWYERNKIKPLAGCFKLNVDTALDPLTNSIGIGTLIRNSDRMVKAALSKHVNGLLNAKDAECVALTYCLCWAQGVFMPFEVVKSDTLEVLQAYHKIKISFYRFDA
ncbi:hypothetical protein TorRG33x02_253780 [Trema orientale]|uniref:RNase H type-1 domain-containing protein n=1 Tax=Trema orientale TaxID=63057 RepID=A0A2P5DE78_TREOI|nr:hypothetical protein TorRG33x02_253780 [Trema orientale]